MTVFQTIQASLASGVARVIATPTPRAHTTTQLVWCSGAAFFYDEARSTAWKCESPHKVMKNNPSAWNVVGELPPQEQDVVNPYSGYWN